MLIFGPKGIDAFLENGVRQAYANDIKSRIAHGKSWDGLDWDTHEIAKEGLVRETDSFIIESLATKHAGLLNYNYRITTPSSKIVITSDSEPDPRLIDFCRDADFMLVECSGTKEFYDTQACGGWHMTREDLGWIAREAGVKKVVLKHLVIESFSRDSDVSEKMAETVRSLHPDGETLVAEDGMRFDL